MRRFARTRAGLVAIMALAMVAIGAVTVTASDSFTDVSDGNTFHDDINWLVFNGITGGCAAGKFCPNSAVTRGQMAAFLRRTAEVQVAAGGHVSDSHTLVRGFDNVTGSAPTISTGTAGQYDIQFDWDVSSSFGVCSSDNNAVADRDNICSVQIVGTDTLRVRTFDTAGAALADTDFHYMVFGFGPA